MMRGAVVVARRSELSQLARGGATTTPGAVVVALLSQLSQLCGAALVRVRDKVSRSTPFSRVVTRRAVLPSRVACVRAQCIALGAGFCGSFGETMRQLALVARTTKPQDSPPVR